jgi:hypothetical protein
MSEENKNNAFKNEVIVDVDYSRQQPILIAKPSDAKKPETREEAAQMVHSDIVALSNGLSLLIYLSEHEGYDTKESIMEQCFEYIKEGVMNMAEANDPTPTDTEEVNDKEIEVDTEEVINPEDTEK